MLGYCATIVDAFNCPDKDEGCVSSSRQLPGEVARLGREPTGRDKIDLNPKREGFPDVGGIPLIPLGMVGAALVEKFSESGTVANLPLERVELVLTETLNGLVAFDGLGT